MHRQNRRDLKHFALGAIITTSSLSVWAAVSIPHSFKPGEPIRSSEVNANFTSLQSVLNALETSVASKQTRVSARCNDGSSIKEVREDGSVVCELDDVGTGGSSYTAGAGLKLIGTAFSVDTVSVQARVTATCAAGSSIREVKPDGAVTCETDDAGSGGSSYTAGAGLALNGTQFSLADAGVGSAKIADGAISSAKLADGSVTSAKLGLPLTLSSSLASVLEVNNSGASSTAVKATSNPANGVGVLANAATGVFGVSDSPNLSVIKQGVRGRVGSGTFTNYSAGVLGESSSTYGVVGVSLETSVPNGTGVFGRGGARGVTGLSTDGIGVYGSSFSGISGYFSGGSGGSGVCSFNGGAGWSCTSDRNAKENFQAVDVGQVLEAVTRMPVTRWNMKGDRNRTSHIGPVAQDFRAAFGVGEGDKTINTADAQGVAFAAIQGLHRQNQQLRTKLATLEARITALEHLLERQGRR